LESHDKATPTLAILAQGTASRDEGYPRAGKGYSREDKCRISIKMSVHNPRGELKGAQTGETFRQGGRRAEFGFAYGRGGVGAGSLLGVRVSALRALWVIKI